MRRVRRCLQSKRFRHSSGQIIHSHRGVNLAEAVGELGHSGQRLLFAEGLQRVHSADNAPRVIIPSGVVGRRFVEDAQDRTQFFLGEHPGRKHLSQNLSAEIWPNELDRQAALKGRGHG